MSPLRHTHRSGRILSATQLPFFQLRPPRSYGILTTTGRKTGKQRARCLRMVRRGDKVFLVAIGGRGTHWAENALASPEVKLRLPSGRFRGRARELRPEEREEGLETYSADVGWFERLEWRAWRNDGFTPEKSRDLHRRWFAKGMPLVVDLD